VQAMWDRNFFLEEDEIDRDTVREILRPSGKNELERQEYFTRGQSKNELRGNGV
jgi:hypothetical protein